jgi:predicted lipoprotein
MKKKVVKYFIWLLIIGFVGYHSVYFEKIDASTAALRGAFNAESFARDFYKNKLIPRLDSAVDLNTLLTILKKEPSRAFKDYSHALAIGNVRYFLIRGEGTITSIGEDVASIILKDDPHKTTIPIATEFIYGNAIRDASGLINLNDFNTTADVNSVSEKINSIIRNEVLPPFIEQVKVNDQVRFTGAIELNQVHIDPGSIEVIPIQLSILK